MNEIQARILEGIKRYESKGDYPFARQIASEIGWTESPNKFGSVLRRMRTDGHVYMRTRSGKEAAQWTTKPPRGSMNLQKMFAAHPMGRGER